MKKIYSLMLALFATLCVGVAYAEDPAPVTFTLNVDDPNAVLLQMTEGYSAKKVNLNAGDNEITVPYNPNWRAYEMVRMDARSGYLIDSLTVSPADAPQWEDQTAWGMGYSLDVTEDCEGATYTLRTTNLNKYRTDSVVFVIDNPSNVKVMYYGSGSISIKEDTTVVYYCSDSAITALKDLPMTVRPNWGNYIYKVFLNKTELKAVEEYGETYYAIEAPKSGDTIRVLTEAPEGTMAPAIITLDSVAKLAFDSVMVNDSTVALKDTILVPWGKEIALAFNIADYEVTVNNTPLGNYNNPYTAVVTDTTEIVATAKAYEKYDVTLILHDYTCFEHIYVDNYIYPEQDTTVIPTPSKNPRVNLYAAKDCVIDSIKWNNEVKTGSTITCPEEGVLEVWAHKVVREQKFMLYVQRDSMSYTSISTKLYHYFCDYYTPLEADYTECLFSEADDNPINASISTLSYNKAVCYLNDSILTPGSWGTIEVTLADGDVFKAYADTAEVYTVKFVLYGEATTSDVTKDRIVAVEASKFTVLQNTEVSFKTAETTIRVNGQAVEAVDGVVTVTIVANTTIEVGVKPSIANTAENPYTIAEAIELTKAGVALDDTVYVIGVVDHIGTTDANIIKYGNIDVYLKQDTLEYEFFRMLNIGGAKFDSAFVAEPTFVAGDTLIAKGTLTYYASKNMYELNEKCQLVEVRKVAVEPEIAQYQLHGSWVENWGGPVLKIAEDKATATATVEMKEGSYNFGIKQIDATGNQIAWMWTANTEGDTFTREANAFVFVNEKEVSGKNPTLAADVDGVYTFVWTYADNTLTITFPAKSEGIFNTTVEGQAEKFVRDGQLIIRMNGVEYNVLGAKLQ